MGGAGKLSILLAAVACALALAACGSGGDSTATTGTTAETTTAQAPEQQGGGGAGGDKGSKGNGGNAQKGPKGGDSSKSGGSKPVKGGVEPSSNFETQGGDNSIQEYGDEVESQEREEGTAAVAALYDALRTGKWATVCNKYLSAKNLEQIELLAKQAPQIKGNGCPEILGGLNSTSSGKTPDTPAGVVASMRVEGETAFAIYRGIDGKGYAVPMVREGGKWKLTALAPTPLGTP